MKKGIVKDAKKLRKPCKDCPSVDLGMEIGEKLLESLESSPTGVGLAANQIGINMRVCVVNVSKPIILVNPRITSQFGRIIFEEGCLSFPGESVITERYANISVEADNFPSTLFFRSEENALECVCVQHEIDHLDGITMHDRRPKEN